MQKGQSFFQSLRKRKDAGDSRSKRILHAALFTLFMFLLTLAPTARLVAQTATGTISGRITDSSGAIVPGASVILTETDTRLILHGITNGEGLYTFSSLQAGNYSVEVSSKGFKTTKATILLTVAQQAQIDLVLSIGAQAETVNVNANSAAQLDTEESDLAYTVGTKQVADLPLNGRNPYGLAALTPGVLPGGSFGAGISTARGAVVAAASNSFESDGGIGGSNEILIDGVSVVVCCQGQAPITPSVEAVDQFKVFTSVPPAQFGRSSGGILTIITKSGTNALRGDIYEFLRNAKLDAANYFTKLGGVYPIPGVDDFRGPHIFNQFGGFVGGPIILPKVYNGKDKTFLTFGFEGTRNFTSTYAVTTVPTALMRQGIFTEAPDPIYDPTNIASTGGGAYQRQPLPSGCDPSGICYPAGRYVTNINPLSKNLLQFLPSPNLSGVLNNYGYTYGTHDKEDQFNIRLDHSFSPSQRTFLRGARDANEHLQNGLFNDPGGPNSAHQTLLAYIFALGHTWTVSPTFLMQFTYGFAYQRNYQTPGNFGAFDASSYGFSSNFASQQQSNGLPYMAMTGLQQIGIVGQSYNRFFHYTHSVVVAATLQKGAHSITAGFDGRLIMENEGSLGNPIGTINFDTTMTNGPNPSAAVPAGQASFDAFAAYLLGYPTTSTLERQLTVADSSPYTALYVQDDWRLRPNLTLNLGLRYEIETGFRERHNNWADFDPTLANPLSQQTGLQFQGGALFLGAGGNPDRFWATSGNVSPRIGFSYSPYTHTVVRGGFGILRLPTEERAFGSGTIGFAQTTTVANTSTGTPEDTLQNPFPNGVSLPAGATAGVQVGTGTSATVLLYHTPVSYQNQWNIGIEQQFHPNFVFSLNYAGSHGVHLPVTGHPNDLLPQDFGAIGDQTQVNYLQAKVPNPFYGAVSTGSLAASTVQRVQLLSAFPQFISNTALSNGSLTYAFNGIGSNSYNALQAGISYRKSDGTTVAVFYTWSKLLGNVVDITTNGGGLNITGAPGIQDYYFLHQNERSNLATDIPQRIVANFVYQLPFGRGQRFGAGIPGWANEIIGGWQLNGVEFVQSGYPLSLTQSGGEAFSGGRPSYVPGVDPLTHGDTHDRLGGKGQTQAYFNPAAFRLSQSFELGNVPRSAARLRSPLFFQDDLSAIKNFPIHDAISLQFRLEAFNFMNKVEWGLPSTTLGLSGFGDITSQENLPRNVQAALKLYF